ncbi:MAG: STAS domain-containing protein [Chitinispirillaceae bacterium]|nr:STAS domain-containing protein [Chitinispirillaceae bacterium]
MAFYLEREDGERVILHTGTILIAGDPVFREFEESLNSIARQRIKQVIIDFSDCIYMDSHAISVIISMNRRLRASGGQVRIQNANREISDLLHTIQLNRIIEMVEGDHS